MTQTVAKNNDTVLWVDKLCSYGIFRKEMADCKQHRQALSCCQMGMPGVLMGWKVWRLGFGLLLSLACPWVHASSGLTGAELNDLLIAQFATQARDRALAISAWQRSVERLPNPQVLAAASKAAADLGDLPLALQWAKRWHNLDADDSESALYEAGLLLALGQDHQAIALLEATLARFPDNTQVSDELAELLARQGRIGDATRLLQEVVQKNPPSAGTQIILGKINLLQKDFAGAEQAFSRALEIQPDNAEAAILLSESFRQQNQPTAALQTLQQFCAQHPEIDSAQTSLAALYLSLGGQRQAYRIYQRLSTQHPDDPEIWLRLVSLALQENDLTESRQALQHLQSLIPHSPLLVYLRGRLAEAQQQWPEALREYGKLSDGPLAQDALLRMVAVYTAQGQSSKALSILAKLAKEKPQNPKLAILLAQGYQSNGQPDTALRVLQKALARDPENPDLWYALGALAESQHNYTQMEMAMKRVIALSPEDAQAYNFLGYSLLERRERLQEAADYLHKAIALAPDDPNIQDSLGWLYHLQGNQEKALFYLQEARKGLGDEPEVLSHLGRVLWSMGRKNEARSIWQKGLQAHPDNRTLQQDLLHP